MNLIQLHYKDTTLVLHGPGLADPFCGARRQPCAGGQETIDLALEGTPAEIETAVEALNRLLFDAARLYPNPGGDWVFLEARATADGAAWRSPLLGGSLALLGPGADGRISARRSGVGCRLSLTRADWWETLAAEELPLENGRFQVDGCSTILHHCDADPGHVNWVRAAAEIRGDLPAPLRLEYRLYDLWDYPTATVLAAQSVFAPGGFAQVILEGEAGQAVSAQGAITPSADCSGGQYHHLAWSGSLPAQLWRADLTPEQVQGLAGRPVRLLARLAEPHSAAESEQTWLTWLLSYVDWRGNDHPFAQPAGEALQPHSGIVLGPVMHIPPWPMAADLPYAMPLRLILVAQAAGSGAHSLPLDYAALVPLDGWRVYQPLADMPGISIIDDGPTGVLRGENGVMTHQPEGPGFLLYPGRPACFTFHLLKNTFGEIVSPVDAMALVRAWYRPRKKII